MKKTLLTITLFAICLNSIYSQSLTKSLSCENLKKFLSTKIEAFLNHDDESIYNDDFIKVYNILYDKEKCEFPLRDEESLLFYAFIDKLQTKFTDERAIDLLVKLSWLISNNAETSEYFMEEIFPSLLINNTEGYIKVLSHKSNKLIERCVNRSIVYDADQEKVLSKMEDLSDPNYQFVIEMIKKVLSEY